jgi:hypothetical protein
MSFSTIPFIFLTQAFVCCLAARRYCPRAFGTVFVLMTLLTLWGIGSAYMAHSDIYQQPRFLAAWPSLWITFIPVMLVLGPMLFVSKFRADVFDLLSATPDYLFVAIQCLRVLAIGGISKSLSGEFAFYYGMYIGIPDMLYGLSGFLVLWLLRKEKCGRNMLITWHLIGCIIIVPFGLVLLQMGLPGPWLTFNAEPSITTIFTYPMALAPTLVVPIFVILNLFSVLKLLGLTKGYARSV